MRERMTHKLKIEIDMLKTRTAVLNVILGQIESQYNVRSMGAMLLLWQNFPGSRIRRTVERLMTSAVDNHPSLA